MRFFTSSLLLVFAIACGSTKSQAAEGPRLETCYQGDEWTCAVEAEISRLTNLKREKPLIQSFESSFVARNWSQEQANADQISHSGFPAARNSVLIAEFPDANWKFWAENVAMFGGSDSSDPAEVAKTFVEMWYDSEGHRKNMLGNYQYIGAGVARLGNAVYATQLFH